MIDKATASNQRIDSIVFTIDNTVQLLQRTPAVLRFLLQGLPDGWVFNNEGSDTFSPFDVVGHLVHGEKTDWRERAVMILHYGESKSFVPYDRFAQFEESKGKTITQLLDEFERLRMDNIAWLESLQLSNQDLEKKGMHPSLGIVTLKQLLSTWAVHDLTHIAQVSRVMAKQYKNEIGPWVEFFRILNF